MQAVAAMPSRAGRLHVRDFGELPSPLDLAKMEQVMAELEEGQRSCVRSCLQCWQERRLDEDELLLQLKTLSGKSPTLGDLFRKSDIKAARTTEVASAEEMLELMSMFSDIKFLQESINSRPPSRTASTRSSRSPVRHVTTPRIHIQRTPSQEVRSQLLRAPSHGSCASQGSQSFVPEESEVSFSCDSSLSGRGTPAEVQSGDVMMSIRTAEPLTKGPRASGPKMASSLLPEEAASTARRSQVEPARQFSTLPRGNSWPRLSSDDSNLTPGPFRVPEEGPAVREEAQGRSGSESPKRARIWRSAGNVFDALEAEAQRPFSRSFGRQWASKLGSEL